MDQKDDIISFVLKQRQIRSRDIVAKFKVTRQYATKLLRVLAQDGKIVKIGSTRMASYVLPKYAKKEGEIGKNLMNTDLKEHEVLESLEEQSSFLPSLKENVRSIFTYAFCEMLNNAIEHSQSKNIRIEVMKNKNLRFVVNDVGIGVFRNIMRKRHLQSELEAVQDLLKGKTTTEPQAHSGEGIFFTSKIADVFSLESYNYKLTIDNRINDLFFEEMKPAKRGTKVTFELAADSGKHLNDIFKKYQTDPKNFAFDKTEIQIKLYTMGTIHISRSQARRVLTGLEKFKTIILDFDQVPNIGQAFADEIFRVFKNKHRDIAIQPIYMNEAVRFMVERVSAV